MLQRLGLSVLLYRWVRESGSAVCSPWHTIKTASVCCAAQSLLPPLRSVIASLHAKHACVGPIRDCRNSPLTAPERESTLLSSAVSLSCRCSSLSLFTRKGWCRWCTCNASVPPNQLPLRLRRSCRPARPEGESVGAHAFGLRRYDTPRGAACCDGGGGSVSNGGVGSGVSGGGGGGSCGRGGGGSGSGVPGGGGRRWPWWRWRRWQWERRAWW